MDLGTGRTYETREDAIAAGVSPSDIVDIREMAKPLKSEPRVRVKNGPFEGREYQKNALGQMVRVR